MKNIRTMMKNRLLISCLCGALTLGTMSCTKNFMEYNTNPDEVTDDMLDGDNFRVGAFFPQMQMVVSPTITNHFQVTQNLTGDVYSGYMAGIGEWNGGKNGTTCAFVINDWLDIPFNKVLVSAIGADLNIKRQVGDNPTSPILAFSTILKVACVHRLTDMFGPLPYSKIAEGGSLKIEYDSEETLYKSFFKELTSAIEVLTDYTKKNPNTYPMADYDLVYDGDYVKWVKFANSLKLRMAMRCSYIDPTLAKENAEQAVNHEYGVIISNDDNANLKSGKGLLVSNPLRGVCEGYNDCRMGAVAQSYLVGYNDPRLPMYFQQATIDGRTSYWGARTGVAITSKTKWLDFSIPKVSESTPITWMTAAECAFLRAEGALHGWNMGITAKDAYNLGVSLSFEENGVSGIDTYLNDDITIPNDYLSLKHISEPTRLQLI